MKPQTQCQKTEIGLNVNEQCDFHYKLQQFFLVQTIPPVDINADKLFISHLHFLMSQRDIIPLGTCDLSHIMKRKEYLEHHIMREKVA